MKFYSGIYESPSLETLYQISPISSPLEGELSPQATEGELPIFPVACQKL